MTVHNSVELDSHITEYPRLPHHRTAIHETKIKMASFADAPAGDLAAGEKVCAMMKS